MGIVYSKLHSFYVCNNLTDLKRNFILNVNDAKKSLNKLCLLSKKVHGRRNVNIKNKFSFVFTLKDEGGWFGSYFFILLCPCYALKGQRHKILESFLWQKNNLHVSHRNGTATNVISDMPLNLRSDKHHNATNVIHNNATNVIKWRHKRHAFKPQKRHKRHNATNVISEI